MTHVRRIPISWRALGELVGIASIVASLVFVGLQLKESEAIARAELWQAVAAAGLEAQQSFFENADLWTRANSGATLSAREEEVFRRLVVIANDQTLTQFKSAQELGFFDGRDSNVVLSSASLLHRHPHAQRVWRKREDQLRQDRRRLNPELPKTHSWLGLIEEMIGTLKAQP